MRFILCAGAALLALTAVAGAGAPAPDAAQGNSVQTGSAPADATERLNQEAIARARQQAEERARIEARIRANEENNARIDRDNARRQAEYEEQVRQHDAAVAAERARYDSEMARFREQQAAGQQAAQRGGRPATSTTNRASAERSTAPRSSGQTRTASASGRSCADQVRRNRGRGRAIGGALGGVAGLVGGRHLGTVARIGVTAISVPVGALIGDAIASRLDCREQEQAGQATEQALAGGVGTTITWQSETRSGVSGTSTVTAVEPPPAPATPATEAAMRANDPATQAPGPATPATAPVATAPVSTAAASAETTPCLTVTDVIIVDGEETRAPKRMCRRPPSNRFVRV